MMNTNARLRERLRGMRYFWVVCMLLAFAPPAWAEDYVGQPMNYSVQLEGAGKIAIKANPAAPDWYKQPVKGKTIR